MSTIHIISARLCATLFILLFCSAAFAGPNKVEVCHIPPSDPDNYHTIMISEKALHAHLAHFDLEGACNKVCATLCDDGDACTIDDSDDCEQNGCPDTPLPVDCSDGNSCTIDFCDPDTGACSNESKCEPGDICDSGVGVCESPVSCPCWDADELLSVTADNQLTSNSCSSAEVPLIQNIMGSTPDVQGGFGAMIGSCFTRDPLPVVPMTISAEDSEVCIQQIVDRCSAIGDSIEPASVSAAASLTVSDIDPASVFD